MINENFDLQEELHKLPKNPGVYIMHDKHDEIIYVGKAVNLHNRVRSYFRENIGRGPWIDRMVSLISYFEYIVTDSELEALVLENNLIKEHRPKYNTMLVDDKTYPYIKVTAEKYPRVLFSREMKKDKSSYYGPYTSAGAVKDTIELINKLYKIRTCNNSVKYGVKCTDRPCLNYHIGQCLAPCQGLITEEEYKEQLDKALDFLNGNYGPIMKSLEQQMNEAAAELDFEKAASLRDLLASVKQVAQKQKIENSDCEDKDIIAMSHQDRDAVVQVFFVRNGRMIGREHFFLKTGDETEQGDILSSFIKQYYAGTPYLPRELYLQDNIEDAQIIEQWLSEKKGSRVYIRVPQKGQKSKLVELAKQNAELVLSQDKERIKREQGRTIGAVKEIEELLDMKGIVRMEAFDISNISGFENVGSMVVFEAGRPKRSDYRKFKIKTVAGPNDYACMREVLTRRFMHGMEEKRELLENGQSEEYGSFTRFPDLLLMDGGRGQVNIALEVLDELKINIPVCGMVKDDNHRTRGLYYNNIEIPIDRTSEGFKLITRIQDEAHRFAITFHRSLRDKDQVRSVLDEIPGVGPSRRKALMRSFSSIEEIKEASVERLAELPEIPESVAEIIYSFFHSDVLK
ncbi:MAG: excinuclease ABC subunit UvrC [Lachnospiraceae bacterium]|nr:excinuclease ABC subunit UvrC [Candidatus Colinaster scatohippi]